MLWCSFPRTIWKKYENTFLKSSDLSKTTLDEQTSRVWGKFSTWHYISFFVIFAQKRFSNNQQLFMKLNILHVNKKSMNKVRFLTFNDAVEKIWLRVESWN